MTMHLAGRIVNSIERKELSVSSCVEDGVEYDETVFSDFVEYGSGNPVILAREKRKSVFMNMNGYGSIFAQLMNFHGLDEDIAKQYAKKRVLYKTYGFPPMIPVCVVDY